MGTINFATDIDYDRDNLFYNENQTEKKNGRTVLKEINYTDEEKEKLIHYYKQSYKFSKQEEYAKAEIKAILEKDGIDESALKKERKNPFSSEEKIPLSDGIEKKDFNYFNTNPRSIDGKLKKAFLLKNKFILGELVKTELGTIPKKNRILEYLKHKDWEKILTLMSENRKSIKIDDMPMLLSLLSNRGTGPLNYDDFSKNLLPDNEIVLLMKKGKFGIFASNIK